MRAREYSNEQIVYALKRVEAGEKASQVCRESSREETSGGTSLRITLALAAIVLVMAAMWVYELQRERAAYYRRTACVGSLVRILHAKSVVVEQLGLTNGDLVKVSDLKNLAGYIPEVCKDGGTYLINPVAIDPECTYTGTCYTWHIDKETKRIIRRVWKHKL